MKNYLLVLALAIVLPLQKTFANNHLPEWVPKYEIVLDTIDSKVPSDQCLVEGWVRNNGQGIVNGKISTLPQARYTLTNQAGNYKIQIPATDSVLYFFHEDYQEVVMLPYDFKGGHRVVIQWEPTESGIIEVIEKPVIYLYSDQPKDVTISLQPVGNLSFTYPKYEDGWSIKTSKNGMITSTAGTSYPYLFWEAEQAAEPVSPTSGLFSIASYVKKDQIVFFLEAQLTNYGLNARERADFITYWGPRLAKNEISGVHFLVNEEVDARIGGLTISPKPDVVRRIYMLCFDATNVGTPQLQIKREIPVGVVRKGLTVIEWGGTELDVSYINRSTN